MVEKRTFVFVMLSIIVWASLASAYTGFYYLQSRNSAEQLKSAQNSLNEVASNNDEAIRKYDLLLSEYGSLYGNYTYFSGSNYVSLMPTLGGLITDFGENYTNLLAQEDINKTYVQLSSDYEALLSGGNVTETQFGGLMNEYHDLFSLSALREQELSIGEATTLSVNIEVNYGNGTVEWFNETDVPAGYTLFGFTQNLTVTTYSYYALDEPGHVLIDSINNVTSYTDPSYAWGYSWIWYYWNGNGKNWVSGPVGCDAWLLENSGIYRWNYERWSYP